MAQKIKPTSLRLGITKNWSSCWFPKKENSKFLLEEDVLIRNIIRKKIGAAGIDRIDIEKIGNKCKILIRARPRIISHSAPVRITKFKIFCIKVFLIFFKDRRSFFSSLDFHRSQRFLESFRSPPLSL